MSSRSRFGALLVLAVLAAAGALWHAGVRPGDGAGAAAQAASPAPAARPAVPVEAVRVRVATMTDRVSAVGTLRSNESVIIRPEIAGRVSEIHFAEGEPVEQGAPLVSLDDSLYRAEVADAQARVNLRERNYERARELREKRAGSASDLDQAVAELEIARASLELARVRLHKTRISAPFSGILGLRHVSVGSYVSPGQDLVNLEKIDPIKVDFRVPERYLGALHSGQAVQIRVDAFPGTVFEGEVYAIDPQIDPAGRSIALRARIENRDRRLRPGLFARVDLITGEREGALVIPEQAIVPRGDQRFVFRVLEGKAVSTPVEIGRRNPGEVEIVSGLGPDDVVVTAGQLKIRDGTAVKVVDSGQGG